MSKIGYLALGPSYCFINRSKSCLTVRPTLNEGMIPLKTLLPLAPRTTLAASVTCFGVITRSCYASINPTQTPYGNCRTLSNYSYFTLPSKCLYLSIYTAGLFLCTSIVGEYAPVVTPCNVIDKNRFEV